MSYFNLVALFSDTATKIGYFKCSGIYKVLYIIFCFCFYIRFCSQLLRLIRFFSQFFLGKRPF